MRVFRSIQDDDLVRGIAGATRRMVFLAPGVSAAVAKALESCLARHPRPQIMIVLDADEETCRLGYCDAPSLDALNIAATQLEDLHCNVFEPRPQAGAYAPGHSASEGDEQEHTEPAITWVDASAAAANQAATSR